MSRESNNVKAGLFVVAGLLLALVVIFTISDLGAFLERKRTVRVAYRLSDGLQGLKPGAAVTLGDQPIGEVRQIENIFEPGPDGRPRVVGQRVLMRIPTRYQLYQNAVIELSVPPFGSGTRINIRSVGNEGVYDPATDLPGGVAGNPLTAGLVHDLGIEDLQRQQLRDIIGNVATITGALRQDLPAILASARNTVAQIEPLAAEARGAVGDVRSSLANVQALTGEVRERSGLWMSRIDAVTTAAESSAATVRSLLADKDPALRQSVDNVQQITATVRERTLGQVTEALDKANAALENVRAATGEVRGLVVGQRPVLERAMANAQLTSDQLKLTAIEVRRSPWRLLYKPSDKELETDNLYDAARSFALAAGTLDTAAASLRAVAQERPEDRERVGPMLDHLEALFGKFQVAEKGFWDALGGKPAPAKPGR